jgi:DNA (cytosine-5)-methyltransferase 1
VKLRVLDLFSGIGGFSLGLERTGGFETVAFCEIEPFPRRVLAKHWPEVPCYEDVRTIPLHLEELQSADVVTAGFPCQDLSYAGKGAGLAGERSGLWWKVRRTLRLVRPRFALLENVAALLDRGMGAVLGSMAAIGYDAEWHCIPLSTFGAPHRRDRVCIFAYAQGERCAEAWELRYSKLEEWISRSRQAALSADAWEKREQGEQQKKVSGVAAFSWCQNVRGVEDLRNRPDLPTPLFRGSRDGVPDWVERVAACGNAFSPVQVEMIGRAILEAGSLDAGQGTG